MTKFNRRGALVAGGSALLAMPFVRPSWAQTPTVRALMWEAYVLPDLVAAFEQEQGVRFQATFFDGNSEAYNKLRIGGASEFDLVQADGFWPQLYRRESLIRPVDYAGVPNTAGYLPEFDAERFSVLTDPGNGTKIGFPFCWGAYGITYDAGVVDPAKTQSLEALFDPAYSGQLSTSARFEENIALAALLVTHRLGTRGDERPDGREFNPYVLTDTELQEIEKVLIEQKRLLLTRYQDNPTLFQLLQSGAVVAAAEFAQVFRQLLVAEAGSGKDFRHALRMNEGGLGWVDTWLVTTGVSDDARLAQCYAFINRMISPDSMKRIGEVAGCSTTVDLRHISSEGERELYLMDRSAEIADLFMFDQPSSPEKWERVWSNVQAA